MPSEKDIGLNRRGQVEIRDRSNFPADWQVFRCDGIYRLTRE